jgi:hypothetical protein
MLYKDTVTTGTLDLIKQLSADEKLNNFTLAGGTALALQIGHRVSMDIDLISKNELAPFEIARHLLEKYKAKEIDVYADGVFSYINGVKVDMVKQDHNWLVPPPALENIRMASLDDIAAMKIYDTIKSSARMKDFVDIYFLLEHRSLDQILKAYTEKYPNTSPEIAKQGLLRRDEISGKTDIKYIGQERTWPDIANRLKESLEQSGKKFLREEQLERSKPDDPNQSQNRRHSRTR